MTVTRCVQSAKAALDQPVCAAWGIDPAVVDLEEVKHFDRIAFEAEMFFFFGTTVDHWCDDHDRAVETLRSLYGSGNWKADKLLWVSEAERLAHLGACRLPKPDTSQAA